MEFPVCVETNKSKWVSVSVSFYVWWLFCCNKKSLTLTLCSTWSDVNKHMLITYIRTALSVTVRIKCFICHHSFTISAIFVHSLPHTFLTPLRLNCFKAANCSGLNCLGEWHLIWGTFMLNHTEGICVSSHRSYFTSSDPKDRATFI